MGKRVMIVDDCEDNLLLISLMCKKLGYITQLATSGKDAIATIHDETDVVLMDYNMPYMNGCEASSRLRLNEFKGNIFIVSAAIKEDIKFPDDANINGFIPKPVKVDMLREI
jgi:CheY-like chemotaxis protein